MSPRPIPANWHSAHLPFCTGRRGGVMILVKLHDAAVFHRPEQGQLGFSRNTCVPAGDCDANLGRGALAGNDNVCQSIVINAPVSLYPAYRFPECIGATTIGALGTCFRIGVDAITNFIMKQRGNCFCIPAFVRLNGFANDLFGCHEFSLQIQKMGIQPERWRVEPSYC